IGTAGALYNKLLPLSYYSTPSYWGEYVCDELGNDCRVTDVFNSDDYTLSPSKSSPGRELQYERINVNNGTDIYDASTWQIALALAAREGLSSSRKMESLLDLIENQNLLLLFGHDGNYRSDDLPYGINRATTKDDGTFTYNGLEISQPENAFYFRMVARQWLSTDPFMGTEYERNISVENLPKDNPEYKKGKVSWADWKPITGENAWAFLIGPLQGDYIKNVEIEEKNYVPFESISMQNALSVLYAFQGLQSPLGGIYYAATGSLGNVGDESVNPFEISVENNASALAGLWIFQDLLKLSVEHETELSYVQKKSIRNAIEDIDSMLYGGPTPNDYDTDGLLSFFKNYAWDKEQGTFLQGGFANNPNADSEWIPTYSPKAVDVQTWTITVLGQRVIDEWNGFGASYRAWETTKQWGGFYGPDGEFWGVGYSEKDGNGQDADYTTGILSAEWTAGAINLVRALIVEYRTVLDDPSASGSNKNSAEQYIQKLKDDERSMVRHLTSLRTDQYSGTVAFEQNRPTNYDTLVAMSTDKLAFLYSSKRYFIPFGWYANPIPSTCSTSWALMLHYNYNPFQLGGGYRSRS
ncbi:MAG: hypothetical protein K940chlam7_02143, partial [Chlamydiae bacterium]|nr:hypothetical protein [Chlamydiota bacterium]